MIGGGGTMSLVVPGNGVSGGEQIGGGGRAGEWKGNVSNRTQRPHVNDSGSGSRCFSAAASALLQLQPANMRVVSLRCKSVVPGAKRRVSQRAHLKSRISKRERDEGVEGRVPLAARLSK